MGVLDWLRGGRAEPKSEPKADPVSARSDPVEEVRLQLPSEAGRAELGRFEGGVETIAASADRIYVARKDSPAIQVLDLSGTELATLPGHDKPAGALAAADDGSFIASAAADATTVKVWNPDGAVLRSIERPSRVTSLAIQGDTLAIGHADGSIAVLSIGDPAVEHPLRLPQIEKDGVSKVALSPDGKEVAGLHGAGGLIALWAIGSSKADVIILPYRLFSLRYSPDGRYLAVAGASFQLSMSLSDGGKMTISDLKSILWLSERRTGSTSEIRNAKYIFSDVHWHPDKDAVAVVATEVIGKDFHRVLSFYGVDAVRQGRDRPLGSFRLGLGGVVSAGAFVPGKGLFVSEEDGTLLGWTVLNAEPDPARETHPAPSRVEEAAAPAPAAPSPRGGQAESSSVDCPSCGTSYNRAVVVRLLEQQAPELFLFPIWTTRFKCKRCPAEIAITGQGHG